jgi:hypothetical protein
MVQCQICLVDLTSQEDIGGMILNRCPRCGPWQIIPPKLATTFTLREQLENAGNERTARSVLSHKVRKMQRPGKWVGVPLDDLRYWGLSDPLPTPAEQADSLVLWLGDRQESPSEATEVDTLIVSAEIGMIVQDNGRRELGWLLNQTDVQELIEKREASPLRLRLTWNGWERYQHLLQNRANSKNAFMAMQFGIPTLDAVVAEHFKPAVSATGFNLQLLTDGQGAGIIDDQIRVRIRTSRFVIADLSHGNKGAYWEAGFAEGLGKPVIYTCEQSVWDEQKTHFDTNHLVTIVWEPGNLQDATQRLKATIRATLPEEATLED